MQRDTDSLMGSRILIVDDVPANLKVLRETLEQAGYRILLAPNGEIALMIAKRQIIDLILLDVLMPDMDGYEPCRRLKQDETTRDTPVIFVTAREATDDILTGFHVGGGDYITKPFQSEVVLARVETHLKLNRLTRTLAQRNEMLEQRTQEIERALAQVKMLSGLIPICANCKQIRDDKGYWHQVEVYIRNHSEAEFSHGLCPPCNQKLFPEYFASGDEDESNT